MVTTQVFFQNSWLIVGDDIISFSIACLTSCTILEGLNATTIILILKKRNPEKLTEYRQISLCDVLYRCVSKVLANRLKHILHSVISDSQSAFILRRLISDNVMAAHEVYHYLKRKIRGVGRVAALELDMAKAFDQVEWEFLSFMLKELGFTEHWIKLVNMYISTVEYRVLVMGHYLILLNPCAVFVREPLYRRIYSCFVLKVFLVCCKKQNSKGEFMDVKFPGKHH